MKPDPKPSAQNKLDVFYKKAKEVFSKYIRERDKHKGCITPNGLNCMHKVEHCCHVYSANNFPSLEFNEYNAYGGCRICNYYHHTTEAGTNELLLGVRKRFGQIELEKLGEEAAESKQKTFKPDIDFYRSVIHNFQSKLARMNDF